MSVANVQVIPVIRFVEEVNLTMMLGKQFLRRLLPPWVVIRLMSIMHYRKGEPELRILKSLVDPKKSSIDIGANKGVYTYFLSRLSRQVFAYEPNPELAKFIAQSGCSNVTSYSIALSDREGQATLSIPVIDNFAYDQLGSLQQQIVTGPVRTFEVPLKRLDDQEHTNVGFVKIDVEGHEELVIAGATNLLKQQRPNLLIEIEQRHINKDISEVFSQIQALGYEGYFLLDGKLRSLDDFSVKEHQDRKNYVGLSSLGKTYVCNFIFKPRLA
ncbi:methyltransferase FkbM family protein [Kalymmatonema gypsitolerans NIES-4073]|uniref:FkbM family methyltransferase n=1 Tax=Scytonema sp. PRP1 TaxID=3120513 RepID=UPI000B609811|nr:methyltransferase FkbM family protein [Scytonema sp. NIES-4073]